MSRIKKTILILAGILVSVFILLVISAKILEPHISAIVIKSINDKLNAPVKVDQVNFSLIRHFPYASVSFKGVSCKGAEIKSSVYSVEGLARAEEISLMFNWFAVFGNDLKLRKVKFENASLNFLVDENGRMNYDILKPSEGKTEEVKIELQEVELKNTAIRYYAYASEKNYYIISKDISFSGEFSNNNYTLDAKGSLFSETILINDVNYLSKKDAEINVRLNIDRTKNTYAFRESTLKIQDMELSIDGEFRDLGKGTGMDIRISSRESGLQELLSLLPEKYTRNFSNYRYKGAVFFDMSVKGTSSESSTPLITANFGTENASVKPKSSDYSLKEIRFRGKFSSKISQSQPYERLELKGLHALLEGQPVNAELLVENFKNPLINLNAKSKINLEVLSRFYMPDTLESMNGMLIVDANIKGRTNDKNSWISQGALTASDVSFRLKNKNLDFNHFNGVFELKGNRLTVSRFQGNAGGSDFTVTGNFDNAFDYLLSSEGTLSANANISCRNLDLNELLEDNSADSPDTTYRLDISNRINMNLAVDVGLLQFRKFEAWQVKGNVTLKNQVISADNLAFRAFEGHLLIDGKIDTAPSDSIRITCNASIKNLDVNMLFYQMGNFGQKVLVSDNVNGRVTANVSVNSVWSKDLHCNMDRIYAKSNLTIENGELINFKPMLALNKYLKGADLNRIKFNTLTNQIEIRNQTVYIPSMQINSSAMDLTASGTHTFNNQVDYRLQLLLSQLTGKKVRSASTEFGNIEDDGLGRMKIFLSMKGPVSDPKITYDRKGVEQKIAGDIKEEKQNLKNILKEEFGLFRKDTVKPVKQPEKKKPVQELELDTDEEDN